MEMHQEIMIQQMKKKNITQQYEILSIIQTNIKGRQK